MAKKRQKNERGSYRNSKKRKKIKKRLLLEFGSGCVYCEIDLDFFNMTIDHVIPLSVNGMDHVDNMVPSCIDCNQSKGKMTVIAWINSGTAPKGAERWVGYGRKVS